MGSITINSNIPALSVQRRLAQSTEHLGRTLSHLSSGLRIERASDDAAGLAISEQLNVDARVYAQGIRNVSDAVSLANVAEGALRELMNITLRQKELAQQAANGTNSHEQRSALNQEANALVDEFNRIIRSTSFNGLTPLASESNVGVQAGYGSAGTITFSLSEAFQRTAGDGTFVQSGILTAGDGPEGIELADFNGDGAVDLVTGDRYGSTLSVYTGNGDGTFDARTPYALPSNVYDVLTADLNSDGAVDIAFARSGTTGILLGSGDGTFDPIQSYATPVSCRQLAAVDVNGDGALDIVGAGNGSITLQLGNGDGTLRTASSFGGGGQFMDVEVGDFNGDGNADVVGLNATAAQARVFLGDGSGGFAQSAAYTINAFPTGVAVGDYNRDGYADFITAEALSGSKLFLGNGDGTFQRSNFATGSNVTDVETIDIDGDGYEDLLAADAGSNLTRVFMGNGDGTFSADATTAAGGGYIQFASADVNNDGAIDFVTAEDALDQVRVTLSNAVVKADQGFLNIRSQEEALSALDVITGTMDRISRGLAAAGAMQSRFSSVLNTLQTGRESFLSARSQISDSDAAEQTAELVRARILQQAGAAVLMQANQLPALALKLLKP